MTNDHTNSQRIIELVAHCLDRIEDEGAPAIDAICADHPEVAEEIRRRVSALADTGLIEHLPNAHVPEQVAGFRILRTLGRGGMGVVYLAEQTGLGRQVALKLVRPELLYFDRTRKRFAREVDATLRLRHPGIVPVHAAGEDRGIPYCAMEYVEGATLTDVMKALAGRAPSHLSERDLRDCVHATTDERGDRPASSSWTSNVAWPLAIARLGIQVSDALQHAHERGVLHRDVKPSNLMLTPEGHVKLLDFGLALADGDTRLTQTGAALGSLAYMAPEQIRDTASVDARTDVYGLGVALYELLALRLPYAVEQHHILRQRILEGQPASLRTINPSVSSDLAAVVSTAMDPEPARRYASAAQLRDDLTAVLEDRPICASLPGTALRLRRWVQRRPARAAALALSILSVVGGPMMWALAQQDANRRKERALVAERDAKSATAIALERANEHLADAQRAVEVIADVARHELQFVPDMGPVRTRLLEHALAFSQSIATREGNTPDVIETTARAFFRVGVIEMDLGHYASAKQPMENAVARAQQLLATNEQHAAGLKILAQATVELGSIEDIIGSRDEANQRRAEGAALYERWFELTGDVDAQHSLAGLHYRRAIFANDRGLSEQAVAASARAIEYSRKALEIEPDDFDEQKQLGLILGVHGKALSSVGRFGDAIETLNTALELQSSLRAQAPDDIYAAHALGMTHVFLARVHLNRNDYDPCEEHFTAFFELFDWLDERAPDTPMMRSPRFMAHSDYAVMLKRRGDPARALEHILLALKVIDTELARPVPMVRMHGDRGRILLSLGTLLRDNNQHADALPVLNGAIQSQRTALAHDPMSPALNKTYFNQLWIRSLVHMETRDYRACAADARRIHEHVGDDQDSRRTALGLLARASQGDATMRDEWLDECFAWLRKMVDGGWSDSADLTDHFALEGLRRDPRYTSFVEELRTGSP